MLLDAIIAEPFSISSPLQLRFVNMCLLSHQSLGPLHMLLEVSEWLQGCFHQIWFVSCQNLHTLLEVHAWAHFFTLFYAHSTSLTSTDTHTHTRRHTHNHTHTYTHTHTHTHTQTHTHTHSHTFKYTHAHTHTHTHPGTQLRVQVASLLLMQEQEGSDTNLPYPSAKHFPELLRCELKRARTSLSIFLD